MKIKFIFHSILIPVVIFIIFAPMPGFGMGAKEPARAVSKEKMVWPPPPYEPRIEFIKDIAKPDDIAGQKGFFKKAFEFIAGKDEESLIIKPFSVAVDDRGKLYVTDTASSSIHILDIVNKKHSVIEEVKGRGFASPVGIAVDSAGNIYMSDSVQKRV